MRIRVATAADLDAQSALSEGLQRNNGAGGIWHTPRAPEAATGYDERRRAAMAQALARRLDEPEWTRLWHAVDEGGAVVGQVSLRGNRLPAEQHRCTLGMGILPAHRGKGLGRVLLQTAIDWAMNEPMLDWIDLGVFEGNTAAIRLYESAGFVRCGAIEDRFRVHDVRITDIQMALRLRDELRRDPRRRATRAT